MRSDEWTAHIDWWRMISFLLWYELLIQDNQDLFAKIPRAQWQRSDYIDDAYAPNFRHCAAPTESSDALQQQA
jgi:hypothetical protein